MCQELAYTALPACVATSPCTSQATCCCKKEKKEKEMIDLATRKQDWNKMCREVWGPRDYLEEHKKRKQKKQKEMEATYQGEGGGIHGSGHGGSVKDGQFMG